ncbi:MAG TPA: TonB-dependent receptor [Petrimonas sp.]|jgi:TonB-linked SusC/RagA family outer membrane protein|nr:TonB-dependent receptor [Petrimonas sp.]
MKIMINKLTLLLLCTLVLSINHVQANVLQQSITITGKVTDEFGESVPSATIMVKGTSVGVVSDINGQYSINVPNRDAVLVFSYIGFITQEVVVGNQREINVTFSEDLIGLEEVVVIGYGSIRTADITSAVVSVKPESYIQGSVRDVGQLIQGKVAGLIINTTSGNPSGSSSIRLRGNTTLHGTSTNPLILIDGVPGDFSTVSPNDIESIDVLKDGSAAAIYGTRGTNGVIIITTKRASADIRSRVDYSSYLGTQSIRKRTELLDANDYRRLIAEGVIGKSHDYGGDTDWLDEISRTPLIQNHNLTIRGGNQQTNYLLSMMYNNSEGIFKKSYRERFNIRADMNHNMFDGLLQLNIGILSRNDNSSSFSNGIFRLVNQYHPTIPVKDENGKWFEAGIFEVENPVARIMEQDNSSSSLFNRINGTITLNPIEGLSLKALLSWSKYHQHGGSYETHNHISTVRNGRNGSAWLDARQNVERLINLTAEYRKNIGDHNFTLLGGYSYEDFDGMSHSMNNTDFPTDIFGRHNIGLAQAINRGSTFWSMGSNRSITNLIGFFGRVNYNYKDRYILMASLRHEGASQLWGTKNPWGTFPSISLGWRLKEESFLRDVSYVNEMKLRAGYGVTGTQPNSSFLGVATLGYSGAVYTDGEWMQTLVPSRNPNPYLRWEEKKETNIGLDYAFFRSRISGSIDYYNRVIDGLLYDYTVPVPPNLVNTTRANVGKMKNNGIELLLRGIPVKTKDFEWSADLNFSTNKNKLVTLSDDLYEPQNSYITAGDAQIPIYGPTHRLDIGGKIGNFWGYKVIDIDNDGKWIYEDPSTGNPVPYDDFAKVDENKMIIGNGLPKYYLGWNNYVRFKNFDFSVSMRGAFGYEILNFARMYYENTKTHQQYNRLKSAYDPVFGKAVLNNDLDLEYNSYFIEKGDHWKIDNITLGYTFNTENIKYLNSARIYASTLNTFVITKYKGIDPEVSASGLAPGNDSRDKYPTVRTFTIGINLSF